MSYSQKQISHTINFIVNQLRYNQPNRGLVELSARKKERLYLSLFSVIDPIEQSNPKLIKIEPSNEELSNFFTQIKAHDCVFPKDTTIIMKQNGISYMWQKGNEKKVVIYDLHRNKRKTAIAREESLLEQMQSLSLSSSGDGDYSEDDADVLDQRPIFAPNFQDYLRPKLALMEEPTPIFAAARLSNII